MKIKTTEDYSKFSLAQWNRAINEAQVRRLVESLQRDNLLAVRPILVSKNMEVVDGQHRLEAAKRCRIPVHYAIIDDATVVTSLNTAQLKQSMDDICKAYALQRKIEPYAWLYETVKTYKFLTVAGALKLVGGGHGGKRAEAFRRGGFSPTADQRKDLVVFCDHVLDLAEHMSDITKGAAYQAYFWLWRHPDWDASWMLKRAQNIGRRFVYMPKISENRAQLIDIYNWRRTKAHCFKDGE